MPTRVTKSSKTQIDLLFAPGCDELGSVGCAELGFSFSDHHLIYCEIKNGMGKRRENLRMMRSFHRCNVDQLLSDLDSAPWHVMDSFSDIDSKWDFWKMLFWQIVDSHAPPKVVRVRWKHFLG